MDLKNIKYNYQIMEKYGRLELIIGPMYASKTTELIKTSNRYKSIQKNILAINHKINNRYGPLLNSNKFDKTRFQKYVYIS